MRIKHNISAKIANRNRAANNSKLTKNLEKLSTGYRINRAGDDAAGLALVEKMQAMISGMDRAIDNISEGIGLIQVGEGALQEVHDMLDRVKTLAVQSSDGTYSDDPDRKGLQAELDQILKEIERIASTTNFNGIPLFQDEGLDAENTAAHLVDATLPTTAAPTLNDLLADRSGKLKNIIYTETVFNSFETTQSTDPSDKVTYTGTNELLARELASTIVPQVVSKLVDTYPAFGYLTGSSIGIGLELYESSEPVLASVSVGYTDPFSDFLTYKLRVNTEHVDLSTLNGRNELEQTIAHEMIHALMDEATTVGMIGMTPSGKDETVKFPSWFVEGMAQTASGPGNWTRAGALNLSATSTTEQIQSALSSASAKLGSGTSDSEYGTGYLACMYLGYLASGASADMASPTDAAESIASGLSNILGEIISGRSLESVINEISGGIFTSISGFESNFATNAAANAFVQSLLQYTSTPGDDGDPTDGNLHDGIIAGGLISGDLSNQDPVNDDDSLKDLKLFALNTSSTNVKNVYPSDVTILSGGGSSIEGTPPTGSATPPPSTPSVSYPADVFEVTGGTSGDWSFDTDTGTLTILRDTTLTISGGTLTNADGTFYGNIVIADGLNVDLTLDDVAIDATKRSANSAGISIGNGSNVTITTSGESTITGSGTCAGIQLTGNDIYRKDEATVNSEHAAINDSSLTLKITDGSKLTAIGGTSGSRGGAGIGAAWSTDTTKSDITITGGGDLIAKGGNGGAGIGGSEGGSIGNITINGTSDLNITAKGGAHGAGIGGGGWVSTYPNGPQHVESITITGDVNIDASSASHGTGIGGGCHGSIGIITIGDSASGADNSEIKINADGGDDGAAIGGGWAGKTDSITIYGGDITATAGARGAGIGSGSDNSTCGPIEIYGGNITATGSTNASGIGGGMKGSIESITIYGGTITADGGWTNDGGNIGGYTDTAGTTKATVTIPNPDNLTIKAGENGEGKYITTGSVDADGASLYALDMSYIGTILDRITLTATGTDGTTLSFPLHSVSVTTADTGTTYNWSNLKHPGDESAYIWMRGEDITLTFKDNDATEGTVTLQFFEDYGMWRLDEADLPPDPPKEPGYVGTTPTPAPTPPPAPGGAIVIQAGAERKERVYIPRFYFSFDALKLGDLDISTQTNAQITNGLVDAMVERVSEIRGQYGALQNTLSHISNHLGVNIENLTESVSVVRDTDMAEEMMEYTKNNILLQSSQAMLAQANTRPEGVLQLFR